MVQRILDKVLELDSAFDKLLQKMYDMFMPSKNKIIPFLHDNPRK